VISAALNQADPNITAKCQGRYQINSCQRLLDKGYRLISHAIYLPSLPGDALGCHRQTAELG